MSTTIQSPRRMSCMEIWGGNTAVEDQFETVGLEAYVHCQPFNQGTRGGDIYYVTSCASARITRMLLADVSGHGEAASELAVALRDLMRQNVNSIDQSQFVAQMNREFGQRAQDSAFATAVVATYFHPTRSFTVALAGHPNPLKFDQQSQSWQRLVPADGEGNEVSSIPLGVDDSTDYRSGKINVQSGDMFLLYSDAFIECELEDGRLLGLDGLTEMMNEVTAKLGSAGETIPLNDLAKTLVQEITRRSPSAIANDDATLILGRFNELGPRWRDDAVAPIRLLGSVKDKTDVG